MPINKCRVCNHKFFKKPLLRYENMPKSAQFLPTKDMLKNDKGITLEIYQCSGCGLVQLRNNPVFYYKKVIRSAGISEEMKNFRQKQFLGFVKKFSLFGKKAIEIGCGYGEYLEIIRQSGLKAYGLEYSEEAVRHCRKKGLKVFKGFIEDDNYKIKNSPFDVFFILNFLEHLPQPNSVLGGIYNNLADEAVGIVEVPNFDMILKNKLFSEFIIDHLFYFTKQTLTTTLMLNGFEVIDCKEIWYDYIISATVKKRKKLDLSYFYQQQKKLKDEIEKYLKRFRKVAIWGAGHQALAIISLLNLSGKIKYIVDSAKFKQNKFSPATHIPIVSPDRLTQDPVEAVIVMAGSYSDEVAKIICGRFDKNIKVSILRDYGLQEI